MSFILPGGLGQNLGRAARPAVQVSTSAKVDPSANNVFSFSMTSAAGNTGLLLLSIGYPNPADGIADESPKLTVRWAAQTMTRIGGFADPNSGMNIFAFGVVNPTSGAQSLQITGMSNFYDATRAGLYQGFIAVAFTGSNTSSVANAFKNWTAPSVPTTASSSSFPVTSAANNLVIGCNCSAGASPISLSSSSGVVLQNTDIGNTSGYNFPFVAIRQNGAAPTSTVNFTWNTNVGGEGQCGLSVSP